MGGFQNDPGTVQQEAGFGFNQRYWTQSFHDSIVATVGGTQSNSVLLDSMINRLTTVAATGAAVLPPTGPFAALAGLELCVINAGANPLTVFAQGSDTINGVAGSTGIQQMPNSICYYISTSSGVWVVNGLGSGFASGSAAIPTFSTQTGVTASSTQTAAGGTPLNAAQVQISTCAVAGNAVTLPPAKAGMEVTIVNNGAQSAGVFGATQAQGGQVGGDTVNGSGSAFTLAVTTPVIFYCFVAGNWVTK